jgi:hypothetical protein
MVDFSFRQSPIFDISRRVQVKGVNKSHASNDFRAIWDGITSSINYQYCSIKRRASYYTGPTMAAAKAVKKVTQLQTLREHRS